jgi:hypothetical protein
MDGIEYGVVALGKPLAVFVHGHVRPLSECGADLDCIGESGVYSRCDYPQWTAIDPRS